MTKIEQLEHDVKKLTEDELSAFRQWFMNFDAEAWDRQIENDLRAGKLDRLAQKALADYKAGKAGEM